MDNKYFNLITNNIVIHWRSLRACILQRIILNKVVVVLIKIESKEAFAEQLSFRRI